MRSIKIMQILFCIVAFSRLSVAQKISEQQKERLYKTPQYWKAQNLAALKRVPLNVQNQFNARNAELKRLGHHFTTGPTAVTGVPLERITMKLPAGFDPSRLPKGRPVPRAQELQKPCLEILAQATDPAVDMRDYGIITPVRNQGMCGCCWDFGTVAAFETSVLLQNGYSNGIDAGSLSISEQQVLNCTGQWLASPNSCADGSQGSEADYISNHQIVTQAVLPYQGAQQSNCPQNPGPTYRASGWGWLCSFPCMTPAIMDIKRAICQHGSVVSAIQATSDFGNFVVYPGGDSVFTNNDGAAPGPIPLPNHVIQIIGWDDHIQAWLIKNSWDTWWGEGGFAWVGYGVVNIGTLALWIDAVKTNNACNPGVISTGGGGGNPTLRGVIVGFDNSGQGMENQDNYWLYMRTGHSGNNVIGNFAYQNQNQGYGNGQKVTNRLVLTNSQITLSQLQSQGGQLEIDRHGQFGGFHDNSDWNTGISLTLVFSDGTQMPVTWPLQKMHCDNSKPYLKWVGYFSWNPTQFTRKILNININEPPGFYADPYKDGDPLFPAFAQTQNSF